MEPRRPSGVKTLPGFPRDFAAPPAKEADMQILSHARDLIPTDRRDREFFEGAIAALVLLAFLGLALGAAAVDVTRLVANVLT
jgi:hypothetical protein